MRDQLQELSNLKVYGQFSCSARQDEVPEEVVLTVGCYVILDEHERVAYVGMVMKSPHETTNPNATGLWGRVRGHDDSQAKSDPVAFIVTKELLLTPPPTINTPDDVHRLRRQVIEAAREQFRKMTWFGIPTNSTAEARELEVRLRHQLAPYTNAPRRRDV